MFDPNAVVRMRAIDAIEKITKIKPELLRPYKKTILSKIATIEQKEVQWHVAQIIPRLELSSRESLEAKSILERYLKASNSNKVLLALIEYGPKKRFWNGLGGWAEIGETVEDAVVREIQEETMLVVEKKDLKKVFEFEGGNYLTVLVATAWKGELAINEAEVKELRWFRLGEVPFADMFPGTEKWLPKILKEALG